MKTKNLNAVHALKDYSNRAFKTNPWFKKAAKLLSINSKINIQKSYWRLKEHVAASGQVMNANLRIKLIKLFSILNRHVEINKWKSFYYILNCGKTEK